MRARPTLLVLSFAWLVAACGPTNPTTTEIPGLLGAKGDGDDNPLAGNVAGTDDTDDTDNADTTDATTLPGGIPGLTAIPLLPDVHAPGVMLPANKTEIEASSGPGEGRPYFSDPRDTHPSYAYTGTPSTAGRLPGEFEPVQALLIGWAGGATELLPTFGEMLAAVAHKVPTIVYVKTNYEASQIYNS